MAGVIDPPSAVYREELRQFFPAEKYRNNLDEITHYQILSGNLENFNKWISSATGTAQEQQQKIAIRVNSAATEMMLSPLHVAAMTGQTEMAEALLNKGADVNARDARDWTPLHWAAATGNQRLIAVFKDAGAKTKQLNHRSGTYLDVLGLTQLPDPKTQKFSYLDRGRTAVGDGRDFQNQFLGVVLLEGNNYLPPKALFADWQKNPPTQKTRFISDKQYAAFRTEPQHGRIAIVPCDLLGRGQWDLAANKDFRKGELIAEYLGETESEDLVVPPFYAIRTDASGTKRVETNRDPNPDFRMSGTDAYRYRGAAAFATDSFPNISTFTQGDLAGAPRRSFFIAAREIKRGERLTYSYGTGTPLRLQGPHLETNREELIRFAKSYRGSLTQEYKKLARQFIQRIERGEEITKDPFHYFHDRCLYLLSTFPSLAICAVEKAVDLADLLGLHATMKSENLLSFNDQVYLEFSLDFIKGLKSFFDKKPATDKNGELLEKARIFDIHQLILFVHGNPNPSKEEGQQYFIQKNLKLHQKFQIPSPPSDSKQDDDDISTVSLRQLIVPISTLPFRRRFCTIL